MSSPRPKVLLRSSVFQRTLWVSTLVSGGLLALAWAVFNIWALLQDLEMRADLTAQAEEFRERVEADGLAPVIADLTFEGRRYWEPDWIFHLMEEGEPVVAMRERDGRFVVGFDGLETPEGWTQTHLEHEEIGQPLLAQAFDLTDNTTLTLAQFIPEERLTVFNLLVAATLFMVLLIGPLSITLGLVLSRHVQARLGEIAQTAEAVGDAGLSARVSLSGSEDEFDRVGRGVNDMLDRLEALTRNMEAVSVGVAHDLKTPVSHLAGRLQLMTRDLEARDALRDHISAAEGHIERLLKTLDAILRLGEVEAGRRRAAFQTVDLSALVADTFESYSPVFEDADKTLSFSAAPGLKVSGDTDLLTQLLTNLLENVLEHARDGASAWITLTADRQRLSLEVGDDGPGVPEAMAERIFERFVRMDASRGRPGNGLGLSLVRAIAELHGGQVRMKPGRPGVEIVVDLPLSRGL